MASGTRLSACVVTDQGAVRDHNEDSIVVGDCLLLAVDAGSTHRIAIESDRPLVVAVADGLGGHSAGEVASAYAVEQLARRASEMDSADSISRVLQQISDQIYAIGQADPNKTGLGATVVGLVVCAERTWWFNIGDSPLFLLDSGDLGKLSVDDVPGNPLGEAGVAPKTGIVTQVLGGDPKTRITPHIGEEGRLDEQRYLLCSDGLTDMVDTAELEAILAANPDDDARAVRAMWVAAMNAGGRDNITIVLVRQTVQSR